MFTKYNILKFKYILFISIFVTLSLPANSELSVEEIIKILKELKKNLTIFISDHNFRDVMKVCDEIILMNQGEILLNGPPEKVQNDRLAQKLYFGEIN